MPELRFVEQAPSAGRRHAVQPGAVVGREGCDVVLADPGVSRRHAAVRWLESGPAIEDLGSRNGTWVNEARIEGVSPLGPGDVVRIGSTVWRLEAAPAARPQTAAVAEAPAGRRGDVPAPERAPSAIRRVLPPELKAEPPAFGPARPARVRGSAARMPEATMVSFAIVFLTALLLILYFALR